MVDSSDAVLAAKLVQFLNERDAIHRLPVEGDGPTLLELDFHVFRLVWCLDRIGGPGIGVGGWFIPGVFQDPGLAASAPKIEIDAVRAFLGRLDRNAMLGGKLDLFV